MQCYDILSFKLTHVQSGEKSHLCLHYSTSDGSLDYIGPVQTVHAVHPENALLVADDSCLVDPDRGVYTVMHYGATCAIDY